MLNSNSVPRIPGRLFTQTGRAFRRVAGSMRVVRKSQAFRFSGTAELGQSLRQSTESRGVGTVLVLQGEFSPDNLGHSAG